MLVKYMYNQMGQPTWLCSLHAIFATTTKNKDIILASYKLKTNCFVIIKLGKINAYLIIPVCTLS